jgi:hypothetical protein
MSVNNNIIIEMENSMEESSLDALEVIEVDNEDDPRLDNDKLVNATNTTTAVDDNGPKHNYFEILPDELVVRVFSYMKERELFKVSEVDTRFHQMSFDNDLWEEKAKSWHAGTGAVSIRFYLNFLNLFLLQNWPLMKSRISNGPNRVNSNTFVINILGYPYKCYITIIWR